MRDDHGGNRLQLAREANRADDAVLDFSASINPLGLSAHVEAAIRGAVARVICYPDPRASALVDALAQHHDLPAEQIIAGNGSTELLYLLARAIDPRRAAVIHPAFSEYEAALEPLGCMVERVVATSQEGFQPSPEAMLALLDRVDLMFLANPGNPSGSLIPRDILEKLAGACETAGVVLAIDEAFVDFVEEASFKSAVARFTQLVVFRSLTKFFAVPGLRVGYAFVGEGVRDRLEAWRQPWSVNALAEAAGVAALSDVAYQAETRRLVPEWRAVLARGLDESGAFTVYPSAANYLLARLRWRGLSSSELRRALLAEGIAIRDCSSFPGLGADHVRIAVRRPDEQGVLFTALHRCLRG